MTKYASSLSLVAAKKILTLANIMAHEERENFKMDVTQFNRRQLVTHTTRGE